VKIAVSKRGVVSDPPDGELATMVAPQAEVHAKVKVAV
jgi:hypothetical protein